MGNIITHTETMTVIECGNCGILFAVTDTRYEKYRRTGELFFCPNGHHIRYGNNETTRLKAELDQAKANATYQKQRLEAERKAHIATKGTLTKTRNRVKNGMCPCCHRSFVQLERHMKTKHPNFE